MVRSMLIVVSFFLLFSGFVPPEVHAQDSESQVVELKRNTRRFFIDCNRGATLSWALDRAKLFRRAEIVFKGTCSGVLLVDRDHLTLRGSDANAVLIGQVNVVGASNVVIKDFLIQGSEDLPRGTGAAGVNATDGADVTIENVRIEEVNSRGIRAISSTLSLKDITIERAIFGAIVTRGSSVTLAGQISGHRSGFGMSLVGSYGFARNANLDFQRNSFGLLIQLDAGLEHVEGQLVVDGNAFGLVLAGQGVYSFGSHIEARGNLLFGVFIDELSSFTPLIGNPGDGPSLTVVDNPQVGISITRGSTAILFEPTIVSNNAIGIDIEDSNVSIGGTSSSDNQELDLSLGFGARIEFGEGNAFGPGVSCEASVLTRGPDPCGPAESSVEVSVERSNIDIQQELRRLLPQ